MEEIVAHTQDRWRYGVLKNGVCVAPGARRSALIIGDKWLFIRVQELRINLSVRGEPVKLAPYLVYASPGIAGEIPVREYEVWIADHRFGIYCCDADIDIDLIQPDGTAWWGMGIEGTSPVVLARERKRLC
jgi:hypothetical protein